MPLYDEIPVDHLVIPIGSNWEVSWPCDDATTGEPMIWAGCTARMQIRPDYAGTLIAGLRSTAGWDGDLDLSVNGTLTARLDHTFTSTLTAATRAVFDVEVTDSDGDVWRVTQGTVAITPEVTTDV